jgi:hypothetical protein
VGHDRSDSQHAGLLWYRQQFAAIVLDARQRLLKPGSASVPMAVQLSYCPIELPEWHKANSTVGTSGRH